MTCTVRVVSLRVEKNPVPPPNCRALDWSVVLTVGLLCPIVPQDNIVVSNKQNNLTRILPGQCLGFPRSGTAYVCRKYVWGEKASPETRPTKWGKWKMEVWKPKYWREKKSSLSVFKCLIDSLMFVQRPRSQKVTLSLWCEGWILGSRTAASITITNYACDSQTQTN